MCRVLSVKNESLCTLRVARCWLHWRHGGRWDPLRDQQIGPSTSGSLRGFSSLSEIVSRSAIHSYFSFCCRRPFLYSTRAKTHLCVTKRSQCSSMARPPPTARPLRIPIVTLHRHLLWIRLYVLCVSWLLDKLWLFDSHWEGFFPFFLYLCLPRRHSWSHVYSLVPW